MEKREVVVIRSPGKLRRDFCPACSGPVALIAIDEAVKISGVSSRAIYRLIEEGLIHFAETEDGVAQICPATLLRRVWREVNADWMEQRQF